MFETNLIFARGLLANRQRRKVLPISYQEPPEPFIPPQPTPPSLPTPQPPTIDIEQFKTPTATLPLKATFGEPEKTSVSDWLAKTGGKIANVGLNAMMIPFPHISGALEAVRLTSQQATPSDITTGTLVKILEPYSNIAETFTGGKTELQKVGQKIQEMYPKGYPELAEKVYSAEAKKAHPELTKTLAPMVGYGAELLAYFSNPKALLEGLSKGGAEAKNIVVSGTELTKALIEKGNAMEARKIIQSFSEARKALYNQIAQSRLVTSEAGMMDLPIEELGKFFGKGKEGGELAKRGIQILPSETTVAKSSAEQIKKTLLSEQEINKYIGNLEEKIKEIEEGFRPFPGQTELGNMVEELKALKEKQLAIIEGKPSAIVESELPIGKQRGFLETVATSPKTTEKGKKIIGAVPQKITIIPNTEVLKKADKRIAKGIEEARIWVLDETTPISAEKTATAVRLTKKYELDENWDSMAEVIKKYGEQLERGGQGVQAVVLWERMSPEGYLRMADRTAKEVGRELSVSARKTILKKMSAITKMPEGKMKSEAMKELLNFTADEMPLTFWELLEPYRYQNMLSGIRTQARNIYSNILNTFITRPFTLFANSAWDFAKNPFNPMARNAKLMDAPLYYKQVVKSVPDSLRAFAENIKQYGRTNKFDIFTTGKGSVIQELRRAKTPKALTIVPRFMEASDKLFSMLIGVGEKARLLRSGMGEAEATLRANEIAQKYLYREKIGLSPKDKAYLVRALDASAELLLKGRKVPFIGKPFSCLTPFITTPFNVAKFSVEYSPLGFVGGKKFYTSPQIQEQAVKATMGSIVTGISALWAMEGKTTWSPPRDQKSKELFYASGRKPYSINVGGAWIPMWYFGPFGLAVAIPAAVKYYQDDSPTALTESQLEKILKTAMGLAGFIGNQTPLQGASGFFRIIEGDDDFTLSNLLGFTAGQMIPAEGFIRWVNTIIDPIYRRAQGIKETIMKDIPILSKKLPYYTLPTGEPSRREPINYFLPYDLGFPVPQYENILNQRQHLHQLRAVINEKKRVAKREMQLKKLEPKLEEPSQQQNDIEYARKLLKARQLIRQLQETRYRKAE